MQLIYYIHDKKFPLRVLCKNFKKKKKHVQLFVSSNINITNTIEQKIASQDFGVGGRHKNTKIISMHRDLSTSRTLTKFTTA